MLRAVVPCGFVSPENELLHPFLGNVGVCLPTMALAVSTWGSFKRPHGRKKCVWPTLGRKAECSWLRKLSSGAFGFCGWIFRLVLRSFAWTTLKKAEHSRKQLLPMWSRRFTIPFALVQIANGVQLLRAGVARCFLCSLVLVMRTTGNQESGWTSLWVTVIDRSSSLSGRSTAWPTDRQLSSGFRVTLNWNLANGPAP